MRVMHIAELLSESVIESLVMHKYSGMTVRDILRLKKASIQRAPLPPGSPPWQIVQNLTWEQVDEQARGGTTGFKAIRKLLTDGRFDK